VSRLLVDGWPLLDPPAGAAERLRTGRATDAACRDTGSTAQVLLGPAALR